tara:strand:+ start:14310 stop:15941 length:1632 start_codon:yes stop_codon:yes gene_type:complete
VNNLEDLEIVLVTRVQKDDVFQLFFTENEDEKFSPKKSIKTVVKGNNNFQQIIFELHNLSDLERLRLDIGSNKSQGVIEIKEIKFKGNFNETVFDIDQFQNIFESNDFISLLKKEDHLIASIKMLNGVNIYDPYFITKKESEKIKSLRTSFFTDYPYLISLFLGFVLFVIIGLNIDSMVISSQFLLITGFFLVLTLPFFQSSFTLINPGVNLEKRTLSEKPSFKFTSEFVTKYESYFNDHFGFRNHLINWGGIFRTKLFRSSLHPETVKFGSDGWLFYNKINSNIYKSYSRTNLLTPDTLNIVIEKWEQNNKRIDSFGGKYILTSWPNKHTIYPEQLQFSMRAQIVDTISVVDQIIQRLKSTNSTVNFIDIRQELSGGKEENQLYQKFDTHWNDYGAFLAYQSFFNKAYEIVKINPKTTEDFDIKWQDINTGDLVQMLGIKNDGYFVEQEPKFTLKKNANQIEYLPITGFPKKTIITRNKFCGNKLKVLVYRDSYTSKLVQFISLHFFEVTYIWGNERGYINKLKPDLVIEGFVERDIENSFN